MSHPTRPTYEHLIWDQKQDLYEWLDMFGECGFRLVHLSRVGDVVNGISTLAVMERRIESDADTRLMELNAELLQSLDRKNDELRKRLESLESTGRP